MFWLGSSAQQWLIESYNPKGTKESKGQCTKTDGDTLLDCDLFELFEAMDVFEESHAWTTIA
jgi:hypothetical protein